MWEKLGNLSTLESTVIVSTSLAAPFTSEGYTEADLLVMITDKCWKEDAILSKIRESHWTTTLKRSWSLGMNLTTKGL